MLMPLRPPFGLNLDRPSLVGMCSRGSLVDDALAKQSPLATAPKAKGAMARCNEKCKGYACKIASLLFPRFGAMGLVKSLGS